MKRMDRKDMLAIYHQGPEAVITVWTVLLDEIEELRARVEQLENQGKKTPKTAICRLQPTRSLNPLRKVFV
jgi:hypothetical protein